MVKSCATCRQYMPKNGLYRCACIFNEKGTPDKPDTPDFCSFYEIVGRAEAERDRLNAEYRKEQK